ncbi:hypothetical protein Mal15_48680 [Stieleria maiorica]|uniref:DUF3124 domain-containing protein n=1 Tax=Stieleria maiorica TaxID=2795974 RepID=A0A5B9MMP6_9BACT|nr:DUF3124 domain-containing protein [Stieleria maiorica]QEG00796.1 hypothetical protein Mal15_48680 [Stieleria maiorica]
MSKKITAEEVDSFMFQFKVFIGVAVVVFFLPLLLYAVYMGKRMDQFEDSLRYQFPQPNGSIADVDDAEQVPLAATSGQVVYVPAYSHVYHEDGNPHLLTITLSIRNTSDEREIVVRSVRYFDTRGQQVKSYLKQPLTLAPLGTTEFLIERDDSSGGSGANFLVDWVAQQRVSEPIIEAVMIDTEGQQGISFARAGTAIREIAPVAADQ